MKIYGIVILCKDEDKYYNDYLENAFNSREKAEKVLKSSIKEEYESLIEDSTENYSLKDNYNRRNKSNIKRI